MARFEELAPNSGVDTVKADDSWFIVHDGGSNQVFLRDGAGYSLAEKSEGGKVKWADVPAPPGSRDPANMVASSNRGKTDRLIKFTATKPGLGRINASKGSLQVSIGFSVHPKKTFKINFFFLQDLNGSAATKRTKFEKGDAQAWVKDLNSVFGLQANIWFDIGKAEPLPLAGLGEVVSHDDVGKLAEKKDGAPINVFLAGAKIKSNERDYPLGFYSIKENLIVVKDQEPSTTNGKPMMKTIAHEIGHLFNYTRKIATEGHSYYEKCGYISDVLNTMDGNNIKIPRQRVIDWNPW
jgi:hypothetical protein